MRFSEHPCVDIVVICWCIDDKVSGRSLTRAGGKSREAVDLRLTARVIGYMWVTSSVLMLRVTADLPLTAQVVGLRIEGDGVRSLL